MHTFIELHYIDSCTRFSISLVGLSNFQLPSYVYHFEIFNWYWLLWYKKCFTLIIFFENIYVTQIVINSIYITIYFINNNLKRFCIYKIDLLLRHIMLLQTSLKKIF